MRFIEHLENEILELKLEIAELKSVKTPEIAVELPKPGGGFKPRHEVARDIRLAIHRKAKESRNE